MAQDDEMDDLYAQTPIAEPETIVAYKKQDVTDNEPQVSHDSTESQVSQAGTKPFLPGLGPHLDEAMPDAEDLATGSVDAQITQPGSVGIPTMAHKSQLSIPTETVLEKGAEPAASGEDAGEKAILSSQDTSSDVPVASEASKHDTHTSEAGQQTKASGPERTTRADQDIAHTSVSGGDSVAMEVNGEGQPSNPEAEWEADSSPYESSSDDSSDSSSSSDDDDSDDAYELLDPAEQARRLMLDDGGSDEEGGKKGGGKGEILRTHNEKPDEVVEKPDIEVTPDMKIEELGNVETVVDNVAIIKANTTGEYQVLETGSLLCLESRTVIGVVAETLGRVQEPLYCVRFPSATAMAGAGISKSVTIYYVPQHSIFVFTKALQAVKGSDASNVHDEEVGAEEMEFSDDEAEAEYKRSKKQQKHARRDDREGVERGPAKNKFGAVRRTHDGDMGQASTNGINYDDGPKMENPDELYTPLARPRDFHEMMSHNGVSNEYPREGHSRPPRGGRGRGDRGRGGGDRGRGRGGRGRGGHDGRRPQQSPNVGLDLSLPPTPNFGGISPSPHSPATPVLPQSPYQPNGAMGPPQPPFRPPFPAFPQTQYQQQQQPQGQGPYGPGQWQGQPLQQQYHMPQIPQQGQGGQIQFLPQFPPQFPPQFQSPSQPPSQPPSNAAFPPRLPFQPGAFVNPAFFASQFQQQQQGQNPQGYQGPAGGGGQQ